MNISIFYPALLVLHLAGLTIMAGTTLAELIAYRIYWKLYEQNKEKAEGVLQFLARLARPVGIGAALLIFTGIGMMALTRGVFGEQVWFRIKFGLVISLIANNLWFGRRQGVRLRAVVYSNNAGRYTTVVGIKKKLGLYHFISLFLFLLIILLSVFKFN